MNEKDVKNRKEIRIVNPSGDLFETVKKLAKENKRTMGKQAEYMLERAIKIIQCQQK